MKNHFKRTRFIVLYAALVATSVVASHLQGFNHPKVDFQSHTMVQGTTNEAIVIKPPKLPKLEGNDAIVIKPPKLPKLRGLVDNSIQA